MQWCSEAGSLPLRADQNGRTTRAGGLPRHCQRLLIYFPFPTLLLSCGCHGWVLASLTSKDQLQQQPSWGPHSAPTACLHQHQLTHTLPGKAESASASGSPGPYTCSSPSYRELSPAPPAPVFHTHDWSQTAHPLLPLHRQFSGWSLDRQY